MKKLDVFRPESFIIFYLLFLLLAGAGFLYWKNLARPTVMGVSFALVSLAVFYLGVRLSKKHRLKKWNELLVLLFLAALILYYSRVFSNFFQIHFNQSLFLTTILLSAGYFILKNLVRVKKFSMRFYSGLASSGLAFLVLTFFQTGGVPLFNFALRLNLDKSWAWAPAIFLFLFGYSGMLFNLEKKSHACLLILTATAIFALTGFRVSILFVLLTGAIAAYQNKKLGNRDVFIALASALFIVMLLGFFISGLANPATLLLYRASTTHNVYEQVLEQSIPFGVEHGSFMLGHARPRDYLGEFFGAENSLTSTMLGPPLMEFGPLFALAWMLFLGFILGTSHQDSHKPLLKIFYPVLLAFSIVWIETGFDQYMLWFVWFYLLLRNMK